MKITPYTNVNESAPSIQNSPSKQNKSLFNFNAVDKLMPLLNNIDKLSRIFGTQKTQTPAENINTSNDVTFSPPSEQASPIMDTLSKLMPQNNSTKTPNKNNNILTNIMDKFLNFNSQQEPQPINDLPINKTDLPKQKNNEALIYWQKEQQAKLLYNSMTKHQETMERIKQNNTKSNAKSFNKNNLPCIIYKKDKINI